MQYLATSRWREGLRRFAISLQTNCAKSGGGSIGASRHGSAETCSFAPSVTESRNFATVDPAKRPAANSLRWSRRETLARRWPKRAPSLLRLLIRANAIRDRLLADRSLTLEEIAKEEKMVASYATRLFRLTLLAPNIVGAILNGNQPPELTARKLMDDTRLPLDWNEQRRALGFA